MSYKKLILCWRINPFSSMDPKTMVFKAEYGLLPGRNQVRIDSSEKYALRDLITLCTGKF
jgi:hypothetical protein